MGALAWRAFALAAVLGCDVASHIVLTIASRGNLWGPSGVGDLATLSVLRATVTVLLALPRGTTATAGTTPDKAKDRAALSWRLSLLLVSAKALAIALFSPDDVGPSKKHETAGLWLLGASTLASYVFTVADATAAVSLRRATEEKRKEKEKRAKRRSRGSEAAEGNGAEEGLEDALLSGDGEEKEDEKSPTAAATTIKTLASLAAEDAPLLCLAFLAGCTAALGNALLPFLTGRALDDAALRRDRAAFRATLFDLAGAAVLTAAATALRGFSFYTVGVRLNLRTRSRLFASILACEPAFFDETKVGDLTSRLSSDTSVVSDQLSLNLNVFARSVTQAAVVLAFMLRASWRLTALSAAGLPFVVAVSRTYGRVYRDLSKASQAELAGANAVADEALGAVATLRAHAALGGALASYEKKLDAFRSIQMAEARYYSAYQLFSTALPQFIAAGVLLVGGNEVLSGSMSGGALISFLLYQSTLSSVVGTLGDVYSALAAAVGAADKVVELLLREPRLPAPGMPSTYVPKKDDGRGEDRRVDLPLYRPPRGRDIAGSISFRGVSFAYPTRPTVPVLRGFDLDVSPGECVALVGASGGGKSSVVKLLLRLYDPTDGEVLVDGRRVASYDPAYLARRIGVVSQEANLFGCSVAENISLGLTEADGFEEEDGDGDDEEEAGAAPHRLRRRRPTRDDIASAARLAHAADFIEGLPNSYDTVVGERGSTLSGGQRQRVCIARCLVRDPSILILDEATSALDAASEEVVVDALRDATRGRTTLVVAHRLSTVRDAHRVVVVSRGRVEEQGTYDELVARGGAFASLVRRQLQGSASGGGAFGSSSSLSSLRGSESGAGLGGG